MPSEHVRARHPPLETQTPIVSLLPRPVETDESEPKDTQVSSITLIASSEVRVVSLILTVYFCVYLVVHAGFY